MPGEDEPNDGLQGAPKAELLRQLRSLREAHLQLATKYGALTSRLLAIMPDPETAAPGDRGDGVTAAPVDVLRQALRDIGAILRANRPPATGSAEFPVSLRRGVCGGQPCVNLSRIPVALLIRYMAEDNRLIGELLGQFPSLNADLVKTALYWVAIQMEAMQPGENPRHNVDVQSHDRKFRVYLDKDVVGVEPDYEDTVVPAGEDANQHCAEVLDTLISNEMSTGWYEDTGDDME